jgi:hypothetical protein
MNMNEGEILEILVDWNFWGNFDEKLVDRPAYQNRMKSLYYRSGILLRAWIPVLVESR